MARRIIRKAWLLVAAAAFSSACAVGPSTPSEDPALRAWIDERVEEATERRERSVRIELASAAAEISALRAKVAALEADRGESARASAPNQGSEKAAEMLARIASMERRGAPPELLADLKSELGRLQDGTAALEPRRRLGLSLGAVADEWRRKHGVPPETGVRVVTKEAEGVIGPHLSVDDVLLALDGEPIVGEADLERKLAAKRSGVFAVRRGADTFELSAHWGGPGGSESAPTDFKTIYEAALRQVMNETSGTLEIGESRPREVRRAP